MGCDWIGNATLRTSTLIYSFIALVWNLIDGALSITGFLLLEFSYLEIFTGAPRAFVGVIFAIILAIGAFFQNPKMVNLYYYYGIIKCCALVILSIILFIGGKLITPIFLCVTVIILPFILHFLIRPTHKDME